jgi:hypothetical protein
LLQRFASRNDKTIAREASNMTAYLISLSLAGLVAIAVGEAFS